MSKSIFVIVDCGDGIGLRGKKLFSFFFFLSMQVHSGENFKLNIPLTKPFSFASRVFV